MALFDLFVRQLIDIEWQDDSWDTLSFLFQRIREPSLDINLWRM